MIFQVNGAVVSVRPKGDKIGMWLGDSTASESITTVGRRVKERLGIDPQVSFLYNCRSLYEPKHSTKCHNYAAHL